MSDFLMQVLKETGFVFVVIVCSTILVLPSAIMWYTAGEGGSWLWAIGGVLYLIVLTGVALAVIARRRL